MSSKTFALNSWVDSLAQAGKLTEDEKKSMQAVLSAHPEATEFVKSGYMAQSEFSRHMDELRTKEEGLKQEYLSKTEQELQALAGARSEFDTRYQKAISDRIEVENRLALVKGEIDRVAAEYAIPDDALKNIRAGATTTPPPTTPPPTQQPAFDASKYMTMEQFSKEAGAYTVLPIEYMAIAEEHRDLFGSSPFVRKNGQSAMDVALARAKKDKVPLQTAWEREFNVAAKREEVREAGVNARIEAARKEAEQKVRSELALQGTPVRDPNLKLPGSPVLHMTEPPLRPGETQRTAADSPMFRRATAGSADDRVRAGIAAFEKNLSESLEGSVQ